MTIGFHIGGICQIGINDNFSINPELLYYTAGAKSDVTSSYSLMGQNISEEIVDKITLSYLQIPILATYSLEKESGFNFSAGPYFGILMGASTSSDVTSTVGQTTTKNSTSSSNDSANSKLDIGLALGVGYKLSSGLGFGIRYNIGLASVFKSYTYTDNSLGVPIQVTQPAYGKNSVISLSVNYMFGGK